MTEPVRHALYSDPGPFYPDEQPDVTAPDYPSAPDNAPTTLQGTTIGRTRRKMFVYGLKKPDGTKIDIFQPRRVEITVAWNANRGEQVVAPKTGRENASDGQILHVSSDFPVRGLNDPQVRASLDGTEEEPGAVNLQSVLKRRLSRAC